MKPWIGVFQFLAAFGLFFAATFWALRVPDSRNHAELDLERFQLRTVDEWNEISHLGRRYGRANGPVVVTLFADYQCPACAQFHDVLRSAAIEAGDAITVLKLHYPLPSNPHAVAAGNAAECAGDQGRFESFEDALYEQQSRIGEVNWEFFANIAGVENMTAFNECTETMQHRSTVTEHQVAGRRLQIVGTPTYLVNDVLYVGAATRTVLLRQIYEASERSSARLSAL